MAQAKPAKSGFTDEERAAMRERAREVKAAARRGSRANAADAEAEVLAKIAEMAPADRALGVLHGNLTLALSNQGNSEYNAY